MEEYNNENVEYCEATIVDEECGDSESYNKGLIGLGVALGAGALAAGAAFVAKKTGKLDEIKAKCKAKKIAKLEAKLEKKKYHTIEGSTKPEKTEEKA